MIHMECLTMQLGRNCLSRSGASSYQAKYGALGSFATYFVPYGRSPCLTVNSVTRKIYETWRLRHRQK